ncbi:MAG: GEVED domain-containing protein, partial [Planctomycetaceae bacterium]|nr:GEVED domain-containing protein [Planctomycetaceae bacterium]
QVKIDGNHIVWVEANIISGQQQIMLYTIGGSISAECISTGFRGMNVSPTISGDYIAWTYTSTASNAASDILYYSIEENKGKPADQKVVHSVQETFKYTGYTSYDDNGDVSYDENGNLIRYPYVSYSYGVGATAPCVNGSWLVWQEPSSINSSAKYDVIVYNLLSGEIRNVSQNNVQDDIAPQVVGNRLVWRANVSSGTEWVVRYIDLDVDSFIPITISPAFTFNYEPLLTDKMVVWRSMNATSNRYSIMIATQTIASVHAKIQIPIIGDTIEEDDETFYVTLIGVQANGQYQLANLTTDGQVRSAVTILNDDSGTNGFDFGDAPASYGTLLADNGARHIMTGPALYKPSANSSIRAVDSEADGRPSTNADGDNTYTSNDENGIEFVESWTVGNTVYFKAYVTEDCYLKAWFDWNHDGSFSGSDEESEVFELNAGENTIAIQSPDNAKDGKTYARFRVVSKDDYGTIEECDEKLKWYGSAKSGEVEDYTVTLETKLATSNQSYYVDNGTLVIKGTPGQDTITITRNANSVELVYNGKEDIEPFINVTHVRVDGIAGNDEINIVGYDAKANKVVLRPYQATITEIDGSFTIDVLNAANINYIGTSGRDIVELYDSAGNDTVTLKPNEATITNGFYTNTVKGEGSKEVNRAQIINGVEQVATVTVTDILGYITAYTMAGGEDQLTLLGSAAADYVTSMGDMIVILDDVSLDQATYYNRAKGFRNITVDAVENTDTGNNKNKLDSVSLFEKNESNVHVEFESNSTSDSASLTRGNVNNYQLLLNNFNTINVTILNGTDNSANLIGSASNDDELIVNDTQVRWNSKRESGTFTDYSVILTNFVSYTADAMGRGTAIITGTDANETLIATDTQINWTSRQSNGRNYSLQANNFTHYSVDAKGGRDEVVYTTTRNNEYAEAHDNAMRIFASKSDSLDSNNHGLLELIAFENATLNTTDDRHPGTYKKGLISILERLDGNWDEEE